MKFLSILFLVISSNLFALQDDDSRKYITHQSSVIVISSACGSRGHDQFTNSHPSKTIKVDYQVNSNIQGDGSPRVSIVSAKQSVLLGCTPTYGIKILKTQFSD